MESLSIIDPCTRVEGVCRSSVDMLELKASNTSRLLKIQEAMRVIDGKNYTLDEAQQRVIKFYIDRVHVDG